MSGDPTKEEMESVVAGYALATGPEVFTDEQVAKAWQREAQKYAAYGLKCLAHVEEDQKSADKILGALQQASKKIDMIALGAELLRSERDALALSEAHAWEAVKKAMDMGGPAIKSVLSSYLKQSLHPKVAIAQAHRELVVESRQLAAAVFVNQKTAPGNWNEATKAAWYKIGETLTKLHLLESL
jgi:hypothetical protein